MNPYIPEKEKQVSDEDEFFVKRTVNKETDGEEIEEIIRIPET